VSCYGTPAKLSRLVVNQHCAIDALTF